MKKKLTKKMVKDFVTEMIFSDKVIAHSDGTFTAKRSYFYHHGQTAEGWADKVKDNIPGVEILSHRDNYQNWPKSSYFEAVFKIKDQEKLLKSYNQNFNS